MLTAAISLSKAAGCAPLQAVAEVFHFSREPSRI